MKVIAGKYKGRIIPFKNKKFNNADITTEKVKEALFSIIGETILEKRFLDLYACSGQIGLEALSRGTGNVVLNEINKKRFNFIQSLKENLKIQNDLSIFNLSAEKCLKILKKSGYLFDIIFVDPPYIKNNSKVDIYPDIIFKIAKLELLQVNGIIIVQHFSKNILDEKIANYTKTKSKIYGNNMLTIYSFKDKL